MSQPLAYEPVATTCPYCGVGCGVIAEPSPEGITVHGDANHPANVGRLCSKGANLAETVGDEDRLTAPEVWGKHVTWFRALDEVANGFRQVIDKHGPDAVAFYLSGQLLTEDYYVANKLLKGYVGTGNVDTNSRLCMSSAVAGHMRAFGEDLVPTAYADIDHAELIVLVGSNTAWCHPIVYRRMMDAKEANPNTKLVVIDPRRTPTADDADLHLPVEPGTDGYLFNGLLAHLQSHGAIDWQFLEKHTSGFSDALASAQEGPSSTPEVARACGLSEQAVAEFFGMFHRTSKTITMFSQGINQSSSGTDKVNAIINCHLLTGRIGKPGMGPFSITGQPNAMGGREVGGLANTLAAHRGYDAADDIQAFWESPTIARQPGRKAVDLFDAIFDGEIKAVWIMATNPVVSMPNADKVREALNQCDLVVVSDMTRNTDTAKWADVLLPAAAWGEKDGTVTNSDRHISRQRPFKEPAGEARPDWWQICEVARRMGYTEGFNYNSPHEIFDEHARLSGFRNEGQYLFDITGLAGKTRAAYDAMEPIQWPVPKGAFVGTNRLFTDGQFPTEDGRARFVSVAPRDPANPPDDAFPLRLNSGRVRDHWHTLTRTARAPRLNQHIAEPTLAMHPGDMRRGGISDGQLVRVASQYGEAVIRAEESEAQKLGQVFMPIHWNDQFASCARVGALANPEVCPVSGEPEFKHTPIRVEPVTAAWHGFAFARKQLLVNDLDYWVRVPGDGFERYELADTRQLQEFASWARRLLGAGEDADWLEFEDPSAGHYRAALLEDDRLIGCIFISPTNSLPARNWLARLFDKPAIEDADRMRLLTGQPPKGEVDTGAVVCSCYGVSETAVRRAIREDGADSVEALGALLGAGTNCGSCLSELKEMLS